MKKLLALLLALTMVFALAACGSSDDAAEETAETEETVEETEDAAEAEAEAPTEEEVAAAEGETADAGDASGEASGEVGAAVETGASGEASGEVEAVAPEDEEEASQEQTLELFSMDGYEKTFEGYIQWVRDALNSQTGNPNLESDLADLDEVTEDTYDPDSMPFQMQIQFGLIVSYEDFLNS
ncbi:MAG: hypothetical protein LUC89_10635 [Oscillospiraceae bacterium]|nr:hypothetical protein [Oscillospiraceae bacterium]